MVRPVRPWSWPTLTHYGRGGTDLLGPEGCPADDSGDGRWDDIAPLVTYPDRRAAGLTTVDLDEFQRRVYLCTTAGHSPEETARIVNANVEAVQEALEAAERWHREHPAPPPLVVAIAAAINELDPEGLLASGAPPDEYLPEAREFAARIQAEEDVTADVVERVWIERFYPGCGLVRRRLAGALTEALHRAVEHEEVLIWGGLADDDTAPRNDDTPRLAERCLPVTWERLVRDMATTTGRQMSFDIDADATFIELYLDGTYIGGWWWGNPGVGTDEATTAALADSLRESFLDEEIWGGWPICPIDDHTHPLNPGVHDEVATWRCPIAGPIATIGQLGRACDGR